MPFARTDSVVITREQLDQGILPDICMLSGQPTSNRETYSIDYQPKWAEAASLGGYTLGGIPRRDHPHADISPQGNIPCPISEQHIHERHTRNIYASVGWVLIPVLGGLGAFMGYLRWGNDETVVALAVRWVSSVCLHTSFRSFTCLGMWCDVNRTPMVSRKSRKEGQICIRRVCSPSHPKCDDDRATGASRPRRCDDFEIGEVAGASCEVIAGNRSSRVSQNKIRHGFIPVADKSSLV